MYREAWGVILMAAGFGLTDAGLKITGVLHVLPSLLHLHWQSLELEVGYGYHKAEWLAGGRQYNYGEGIGSF